MTEGREKLVSTSQGREEPIHQHEGILYSSAVVMVDLLNELMILQEKH